MVVDSPPGAVAVNGSNRQRRRWGLQGKRGGEVQCSANGGPVVAGQISGADAVKGDAPAMSGEDLGLREEPSKSHLATEEMAGDAVGERGTVREGRDDGGGVEGEGVAAAPVAVAWQGGGVLAEVEAGAGGWQNDDDIMGVRNHIELEFEARQL